MSQKEHKNNKQRKEKEIKSKQKENYAPRHIHEKWNKTTIQSIKQDKCSRFQAQCGPVWTFIKQDKIR